MSQILKHELSSRKLKSLRKQALKAVRKEELELFWERIEPLLKAQKYQQDAASCLIDIVREGDLPIEEGLKIFTRISEDHPDDAIFLSLIGESMEHVRDIDMLNARPPDDKLFYDIIDKLSEASERFKESDQEEQILEGLAVAARMVARQRDSVAEQSYTRLVEIDPDYAPYHYNLGLYYKTRGEFEKGVVANRTAASLAEKSVESYEWNLGICATGAGQGELALEVWKRIGQDIELGRFGLPEGRYPQCKVRLAERPLAERSYDNDDPGLEETIWLQRLSPCHGIIRSVLYQDLGVDYGDVVLIDGAPITYHVYDDREVPVFPHLSTLQRADYQFFDFAGTQEEGGQIGELDRNFMEDIVIYPHTENVQTLCKACWRDPNADHEHHNQEEQHIVSGRIAAPENISAEALLTKIDELIDSQSACKLLIPSLCETAGQPERAEVERRRYDMLMDQI